MVGLLQIKAEFWSISAASGCLKSHVRINHIIFGADVLAGRAEERMLARGAAAKFERSRQASTLFPNNSSLQCVSQRVKSKVKDFALLFNAPVGVAPSHGHSRDNQRPGLERSRAV